MSRWSYWKARVELAILTLALRRPHLFGRLMWTGLALTGLCLMSTFGVLAVLGGWSAEVMGLVAAVSCSVLCLLFLSAVERTFIKRSVADMLHEQLDVLIEGRRLDLQVTHRLVLRLAQKMARAQWRALYLHSHLSRTVPSTSTPSPACRL